MKSSILFVIHHAPLDGYMPQNINTIKMHSVGNIYKYCILLLNSKVRLTSKHHTGCLRNYRKSILLFRLSVLGRLRDLQYIFAVMYGTPTTNKNQSTEIE